MAGNRKNRRKKKPTIEGGDTPNQTGTSTGVVASSSSSDPPPPHPPVASKKGGASVQRTYWKIKAYFKCTGKCGKTWSSVHAWEREETLYCDICGATSDVKQFMDETIELDNYYCGDCNEHWQSIHDPGAEGEDCFCGKHIIPQGTQLRFGRHFWFECTSPTCKVEFEDFSLSAQRTQYCSRCKSRGDIVKTIKVLPRPRRQGERGEGPGSEHNWEYCDMCRDLERQGIRKSCLSLKKVHCNAPDENDVPDNEIFTGVEEIKLYN